MAKIYYRRIKAGELTLEDVPQKWKAAVKELLGKDGR